MPTYDPEYLEVSNQETNLTKIQCNATPGFASHVLDSIVAAHDLKESRDRTQKREKIQIWKKVNMME